MSRGSFASVAGAVALLLVAACPKPTPPPKPAPQRAIEDRPAATQPADDGSEAAAARKIGPLKRESAFLFQPHPERVTSSLLAKQANAGAVSPDGTTIAAWGCGQPPRFGPLGGELIALPGAGAPLEGRFSSDSRFLALALEGGRIAVHELPAGNPIGPGFLGKQPRFAGGHLVMNHDCQWVTADLSDLETDPAPLGPRRCGGLLHVAKDGASVVVESRTGDASAVRELHRLGVLDGTDELVAAAREGDPMITPVVSPDGKVVCYVLPRRGSPTLHCQPLETGSKRERVAINADGPMAFDRSGRRLLFAVGTPGKALRDLHVVDFDLGLIRRVAHTPHQQWSFLPEGFRAVVHQGGHALVYDLRTGWLLPFGDKDNPWTFISAVKGSATDLIARAPKKKCAHLRLVRLPAPDPVEK